MNLSKNHGASVIPGSSERFIEIDGYRHRYLHAGDGPPILLIHGLLGYSISWQFNIPELAETASVYALDLLGSGFSDRPETADWSLWAASDRIFRLMDELSIGQADVIATSLGGAIASIMATNSQQGHRVRSLVLCAPVNPWSAHGRRWSRIMGSILMAPLLNYVCTHPGTIHRYAQQRLYGDRSRIPDGVLAAYSAAVSLPNTAHYLQAMAKNWNRELRKLDPIYRNMPRIPTLLIWGGRDRAVSPSSGKILQQLIPGSELVIFDHAGHLPYEEIPDEFNRCVLDFLSRTRIATGSMQPAQAK